jgi:hypothetical protein
MKGFLTITRSCTKIWKNINFLLKILWKICSTFNNYCVLSLNIIKTAWCTFIHWRFSNSIKTNTKAPWFERSLCDKQNKQLSLINRWFEQYMFFNYGKKCYRIFQKFSIMPTNHPRNLLTCIYVCCKLKNLNNEWILFMNYEFKQYNFNL